jgi:hypothetical protein
VTLVTSGGRLLANKSPKISAHAANWITQKGGKVSAALHAAYCCKPASKACSLCRGCLPSCKPEDTDLRGCSAAEQVIHGEKASQRPDGSWWLSNDSRLDADVVYNAVGGKPNTAFLQPLGILDSRGAIKVHMCSEPLAQSRI